MPPPRREKELFVAVSGRDAKTTVEAWTDRRIALRTIHHFEKPIP
jgi:hypothetical protein